MPAMSETAVLDEAVAERYDALRGGELAPDDAIVVPRDVLEVHGRDALTYLQGQLSQDVERLAPGEGAWSLLLEPTGKLGTWLRVTRLEHERFLLDVDPGSGAAVAERLLRFRLRTKADIEPAPDWVCRARSRRGPVPRGGVPDGIAVPAPWPGASGWDVLRDGSDDAPGDLPGDPAGAAALEVLRIEAGVPRAGAEITPGSTIPAEVGSWFVDTSVSFTKGCYTGQELVARIDSRGTNVPHHLRAVVLSPDASASRTPADLVGASVEVGDRSAGTLTSATWSPAAGSIVGLASVGRAVEVGASVLVRTADGVELDAVVRALPLVPA
jgi:folate-binding protein YgfZ